MALVPTPAVHPNHALLAARVSAALGRLSPGTRRQYEWALAHLADFVRRALGLRPLKWWDTLFILVARGALVTGDVVDRYLIEIGRTRAPATVAQRAAAIRWLLGRLQEWQVISWSVAIRGPVVRPYRDVRGPPVDDVRRLLTAADEEGGLIGRRDGVLLRLLFGLGLRRGEVARLRVGDWDPAGKQLAVLGKNRQQRETVTVPAPIATRIDEYLAARGQVSAADALVGAHGNFKDVGELSGDGIYRALERLSRRAKLKRRARPHGLRHSAITAALDSSGGDIRKVAAFARHSKLETTARYDDRRRDVAAEIANTVAGLVDDV